MMKAVVFLALVAYATATFRAAPATKHHHYYGDVINNHHRQEKTPHTIKKTPTTDEKVYTFALGNENGAYGFLDTHGVMKGFWLDLLKATCKNAKKKCVYVVDRYENCWTGDEYYEYPGQGLLGKYYDGCMGWLKTNKRMNSLNFTTPFTPASDIAIVVNEKYFKGDKHNLTGRTAGHIRGWIDAGDCLTKQDAFTGTTPGSFHVKYFNNQLEVVLALKKGDIDFMMISTSNFHIEREGLTIVEPRFKCGTNGYGIMTQYGNPVITWWNEHFEHLVEEGIYGRLCEQAKEKYSEYGPIHCHH